MKNGNWIAISKYFLKALPTDREYTELEAAYSLQSDFDSKNKVTVTGYCKVWRWSKGRVYRFLERMNIKILYPESTSKKRNQNGLITVHKTDLKRTNNGLIRLIDNGNLQDGTDLKRTNNGLKTDLKQVATSKTIKPKDKELTSFNNEENKEENEKLYITKKNKKLSGKRLSTFLEFWDAFAYKAGKAEAADVWLGFPSLTDTLVDKIIIAAKQEAKFRPGVKAKGNTPKMAQGWLSGRRWEDEIKDTTTKKYKQPSLQEMIS